MEELIEAMKKVLAESFAFRLKAQYFHWNVEGPDFHQYHEMFGKLYEEVDAAVDDVAEHIRALDSYSPGSFSRFIELSSIKDETLIPPTIGMVTKLYTDNNLLLASLKNARNIADELGENGIVNFLEERIDVHQKHRWMLKATLSTGNE